MAIIKNATDLSKEELKSLRKLIVQYFRREFIDAEAAHPSLCKIKFFLSASHHAADILRNIESGHLTSFVSLEVDVSNTMNENLAATGFVTGFDTDAGMNNITHLYMADGDSVSAQRSRRYDLLELFATYLEEIKSHGMHACQTDTSVYDSRLTNDLETLEFDPTKAKDRTIGYVRKF